MYYYYVLETHPVLIWFVYHKLKANYPTGKGVCVIDEDCVMGLVALIDCVAIFFFLDGSIH